MIYDLIIKITSGKVIHFGPPKSVSCVPKCEIWRILKFVRWVDTI
jgi:hypothetical protein